MVDVARHLINVQKADEVIAIVRRGPNEVNFTKEEMKQLISYLDLGEFDKEMARVQPIVQAINQDLDAGRQKVLDSLAKADPKTSAAPANTNGRMNDPCRLTHSSVAAGNSQSVLSCPFCQRYKTHRQATNSG